MHLALQQPGQFATGAGADFADAAAALADQDRLLAGARDIDRRLDAHRTVARAPASSRSPRWRRTAPPRGSAGRSARAPVRRPATGRAGRSGRRRDTDAGRPASPRPARSSSASSPSPVAALTMKVSRESRQRVQLRGQRQQRAARSVDLVEHQPGAPAAVARGARQCRARRGQAGAGIDQEQHQIGILRAGPGGAHHGAVEPAARAEDAGRVHQQNLGARRASGCRARGTGWSAPSGETIDSFAPVSRFSRVDLPALGAPTMAAKPQRVTGAASLMRPAWRAGRRRPAVRRCACCRRCRCRVRPPAATRDDEHRVVRRAHARDHRVARQVHAAAEQPFLQRGLRVLRRLGDWPAIASSHARRTNAARRVQPTVEIQRADQRLHGVRQHGRQLAHARARFAGRHRQRGGQAQLRRRSWRARAGTPDAPAAGRARPPAHRGNARPATRRSAGRAHGRR